MFSTGKTLPKKLYLLGVIVIFAAVYSQYFVSIKGVLGFIVVYGIPIAVTSLFFGRELLQRAGKNNKAAFKLGLGLFGALTVVGIFLSIIALAIILRLDPQAVDLLNKPNPVLDVPQDVAWIMVAVSILVVGPAEEYLFRGFLYGGLLNISKGKNWLPLTVVSSLLFAIVHGYYAVTYGAASVIPFITLVTFGSAMAVTYYWTGGNILVPAMIHGVYDAIGFLGVATTMDISLALRGAFITVAVVFAVIYLPKKIRKTPSVSETRPGTEIPLNPL